MITIIYFYLKIMIGSTDIINTSEISPAINTEDIEQINKNGVYSTNELNIETVSSGDNLIPSLTIQESILNDSRITPSGNGNLASKPYCVQPTSGQKWWAAVLLGFVFALISSPAAYYITSKVTTSLGGITLMEGPGPNFVGLLIHTLIFIIIVRIILW